jgi:pimeloyl-ACP methyl ester carboxylesterase
LWPAFGTRYQVFALDYRGHGASGPSSRPFQVKDYLQDVVELVAQHLPAGLCIYGHSLGAMLAAAAAAQLPNRVRGVILEDPPLHTMGRRIGQTPLLSYFQGMARLAGSGGTVAETAAAFADVVVTDAHTGQTTRMGDVRDGASLRFTASCLQRLQPQVLEPIVAGTWLEGIELDTVLSQVQCPLLCFQADLAAGGMLTEEDAQSLRRLVREATVIKFPGVGHLMHWARTQEIANHALAFLETLG